MKPEDCWAATNSDRTKWIWLQTSLLTSTNYYQNTTSLLTVERKKQRECINVFWNNLDDAATNGCVMLATTARTTSLHGGYHQVDRKLWWNRDWKLAVYWVCWKLVVRLGKRQMTLYADAAFHWISVSNNVLVYPLLIKGLHKLMMTDRETTENNHKWKLHEKGKRQHND